MSQREIDAVMVSRAAARCEGAEVGLRAILGAAGPSHSGECPDAGEHEKDVLRTASITVQMLDTFFSCHVQTPTSAPHTILDHPLTHRAVAPPTSARGRRCTVQQPSIRCIVDTRGASLWYG
jgi:hypothetical protein